MENIAVPQVKFGDWISEGWRMFTEQWKAWVLNMTVFFAVCILPIMLVFLFFYISFFSTMMAAGQASARTGGRVPPPDVSGVVTFYILFFVVWIFSIIAQSFFIGGMHRSALKQLRGGTIEFRDLFSGGSTFLPILGATFLTGILVSIGSILCIVPGLLALGCLFFTLPLIIDKQMGVIEAMQTSYALTKRNIWMFMLFALVVLFLASAGSYACYIGLLASYPLLFTITAVAYRDCFGMEGAKRFLPNAPPVPGAYGQQPMGNIYQPPPPPYGQGGFNPPPAPGFNPPPQNVNPSPSFAPPPPQNYNPPAPQSYNPPPQSYNPPPQDSPNLGETMDFSTLRRPPAPQPPPKVTEPEPPNIVSPHSSTQTYSSSKIPTGQVPKPATPGGDAPPVQSSSSAGNINCAKCNASLPATAVFCPRCGTRTKP